MIAKILTSGSSDNLLNYLTKKEHTIIDAKGIIPNLPIEQVKHEFRKLQLTNSRCTKPVLHIILSFPKEEIINEDTLNDILHEFMEGFDKENELWIAIQHPDSENHQHIHVALNRIKIDGTVISDKFSAYRGMELSRKIEERFLLKRISSFKHSNYNESRIALKLIIDQCIQSSKSLEEFKLQMAKSHIKLIIGRGIAFVDKNTGIKTKGSAIGRSYSLKGIQEQLGLSDNTNTRKKILDIERTAEPHTLNSVMGIGLELIDALLVPNPIERESTMDYDLFKKKKKKRKRKY